MISASHNPYDDNGIKFFSGQGTKLPDEVELMIEELLDQPMTVVESSKLGKVSRINDAAGRYIEFCKSTFPGALDLRLATRALVDLRVALVLATVEVDPCPGAPRDEQRLRPMRRQLHGSDEPGLQHAKRRFGHPQRRTQRQRVRAIVESAKRTTRARVRRRRSRGTRRRRVP